MKLTAAPILRAFGFRTVLLANTLVCAGFMASYGFFGPQTSHALILATLLAGGFFRSLQFTSLNTLAYAEIPEPAMSQATTLVSVGQQLSLTVGVGMGALLLHVTLAWNGKTELGAAEFPPVYFAIAVISLLSLLFFVRLRADAGGEMSGRAERHPPALAGESA